MEKECEEKKVTATEVAEELQHEQMECVSGGQGEAPNKDTKNEVGLTSAPLLDF